MSNFVSIDDRLYVPKSRQSRLWNMLHLDEVVTAIGYLVVTRHGGGWNENKDDGVRKHPWWEGSIFVVMVVLVACYIACGGRFPGEEDDA